MNCRRSPQLLALALSLSLGATACGGESSTATSSSGDRPQVVVTFPVLAAVVRQIVDDKAEVTTLMPNGADPHEWTPSAKDIQKVFDADLVIQNGLGLEVKLTDPLAEAKKKGVAVFTVAEHVTVRKTAEDAGHAHHDDAEASHTHSAEASHEHEGEASHAHHHGAEDPHLWMDPLTMKQWVASLAPVLASAGVTTDKVAATEADLEALNNEVTKILGSVPPARRKIVTGHESLGYFADRYTFEMIGAVIPSVTSQAETSAGELAELTKKIKEAGVPALFVEVGTPAATAQAIARDSGAKVVELPTHALPGDGSYRTFMLQLANTVAGALK
jgi:zinc/manganese transport system substrate-binding protein